MRNCQTLFAVLLVSAVVLAGCSTEPDPNAVAKQLGLPTQEDFEKSFQKISDEIDARSKAREARDLAESVALQPLDRDSFQKLWSSELKVEDRPAKEVLAELAARQGIKVQATPEQQVHLARKITLQVTGSSWQQIEAVCNAAGLYPEYDYTLGDTTELDLRPLPRKYPIAFAGPALVEVFNIKEQAPQGTAEMTLKVRSGRLPVAVRELTEDFKNLTFTEILAPNGDSLHDIAGEKLIRGGRDTFHETILKGLNKNTRMIQTCRGVVRFHVPTQVETGRWELPQAGATFDLAGLTFKLKEIRQEPGVSFTGKPVPDVFVQQFEWKSSAGFRPLLIGYDAHQKPIAWQLGGNHFGDQYETNLFAPAPIAAIEVKLLTKVELFEYPFALTNIPLELDLHAQQR